MATETRRVHHVPVDRQGRIVIPAEFREALEIEEGDRLAVFIDDDGVLKMLTADQAITRVQEEVAKYATPGRSVVDELLAERRAEAEQEEREAEALRRRLAEKGRRGRGE